MRYLSVCSGIEAATVAWHSMGWQPVAFSEIEKFPSAVLAHHYPSVPNWGDMTKFQEWPDANVDVLVGGTPCQSFSVAGLRKGLADPRGNLMLTYLAIAQRYRPKWLVWENVPGVLSSEGGRDFAALLRGLDELGYGWAYRVLDAQYFGVAQRRRRVFVVGHLGDWHRAAAVLFERHSLSGHPAPSRPSREGAAAGAAPSLAGSLGARGVGVGESPEVGHCLRSGASKADKHESTTYVATPVPVAFPWQQGGTMPTPFSKDVSGSLIKNQTMAVGVSVYASTQETDASSLLSTLQKRIGKEAVAEWGLRILDSLQSPEVLRAWLHGEGLRRTSSYFVSFVDDCPLPREEGEAARAMRIVWENGPDGRTSQGRGLAKQLAYQLGKTLPELPHEGTSLQPIMQVRRLLPTEAEALQGFPRDYTNIPWRGKSESPDGPRYKALGNSMAVPCMRYIGERIKKVEEISNGTNY